MTSKSNHFVFGQVTLEFLLLNLVLIFALNHILPFYTTGAQSAISNPSWLLFAIFNLSWGVIVFSNNHNEFYRSSDFRKWFKILVLNTFVLVGLAITIGNIFNIEYLRSAQFLLPIFFFSSINVAFYKLKIEFYKRRAENGFVPRILIVGAGENSQRMLNFTQKIQQSGFRVVGVLGNVNEDHDNSSLKVLGNVDEISKVLDRQPVDEIFINLTSLTEEEIKNAVELADYHGVRVNLVPETPVFEDASVRSGTVHELAIYRLRQTPLDSFNNYFLKKIFDVTLTSIALLILSPILITIAILILMDGQWKLFYTPLRKGEGGKTFKCYKFRTMSICDDPVNGTKSTVKNDPRITRIGAILRKLDLDELPQLLNVLKGDMSLVGPRPHRVFLHNDFREIVSKYMVRHYVKPGLTGWAQVNGWRGLAETFEEKNQRVKHDLWYIENWSFWLDIKIMFMTVFSKSSRRNAF